MPTLDMARDWYSADDPTHDFSHIERVYRLAVHLAVVEGADVEIVGAAALLHDAHGAMTGARADHHHTSAAFARHILLAEGWPEARIAAVEHCIRAHRWRSAAEPPATLEARILFDADKLDSIGAMGVARALAHAARSGAPLFAEPSARFTATGQTEPGEAHTAYHEFVFKLQHIAGRLHTASARALAVSRHAVMCDFFARLRHEARAAP